MSKIKLGVAFAGGGVRGASHLGTMQALHEHGIYPELYAGASAGSIVASLLACGYTPKDALSKFLEAGEGMVDVAYGHIAKGAFTNNYIEGFVAGDLLERTMHGILYKENIISPLSVVTTDIDNGYQVIYTSHHNNSDRLLDITRINDDDIRVLTLHGQNIHEVVRASCGIPPIFVPKRLDGMKLVDGGITNNLPSDILWAMGADKVISLDLGYSGQVQTKGFVDVSHMAVNLLMKRVTDGNSDDFGLYLNPHIYDVSALDTNRVAECYDRGYVYGLSCIGDVTKMLEEE